MERPVNDARADLKHVPPVVLLHGYPLDSAMFDHQARSLRALGVRAFTPQLPGYPGGPELPPVGSPDLATLADSIVASVPDAGGIDRAIIGGLSMGGYIALRIAERHPDRVAGLILMNTRASADQADERANRLKVADRVLTDGNAWLPEAMLPRLLGATSHATRRELAGRVSEWIRNTAPATIAWDQRAMAARPDRHVVLREFPGPALIVAGTEDELTPPREARAMARCLARVRLEVLPAAGHLTSIEVPGALSAVIVSWLRDQDWQAER